MCAWVRTLKLLVLFPPFKICMGGRNVFMGYLRQPDKTKEAIDPVGWLRSGDIGKLDDKERMYITGRIKV